MKDPPSVAAKSGLSSVARSATRGTRKSVSTRRTSLAGPKASGRPLATSVATVVREAVAAKALQSDVIRVFPARLHFSDTFPGTTYGTD